jgi:hypothetical protein
LWIYFYKEVTWLKQPREGHNRVLKNVKNVLPKFWFSCVVKVLAAAVWSTISKNWVSMELEESSNKVAIEETGQSSGSQSTSSQIVSSELIQ